MVNRDDWIVNRNTTVWLCTMIVPVCSLVGFVIAIVLSNVVLKEKVYLSTCHSEDISYDGLHTYCLSVTEKQTIVGLQHYVFVFRQEAPSSGLRFVYPESDMAGVLSGQDTMVEWSEKGVAVMGLQGTSFFIPPSAFIDGR